MPCPKWERPARLVALQRVEGVPADPDPAAVGEIHVHDVSPHDTGIGTTPLAATRRLGRETRSPPGKHSPGEQEDSGISPAVRECMYLAAATSKS